MEAKEVTLEMIQQDLDDYTSGLARPFYADICPDAWAIAAAEVSHAYEKPVANGESMNEAEEESLNYAIESAAEDVLYALHKAIEGERP